MENNLDIKQLLGQRIRELRNKKNLTQEQLSETIGITQRNLSKIECGKIFVSADTLTKIITALEVDIMELFNFKHHDDKNKLKQEMIEAIQDEKIDIALMYRLFKSIK